MPLWGGVRALTHGRGRHADAGHHHLEDGLLRGGHGLAQAVPVLVRDGDAQLQLPAGTAGPRGASRGTARGEAGVPPCSPSTGCAIHRGVSVGQPGCPSAPSPRGHPPLPHQRDVDAVGSGHGRERHVAADDGWQVLGGGARSRSRRGFGDRASCPQVGHQGERLPPPIPLLPAAESCTARGGGEVSPVPSQPWGDAKGQVTPRATTGGRGCFTGPPQASSAPPK